MRLRSNGSERLVDNYGPVKQVQKSIQRPMGRTRHNSQIFAYASTPLEW